MRVKFRVSTTLSQTVVFSAVCTVPQASLVDRPPGGGGGASPLPTCDAPASSNCSAGALRRIFMTQQHDGVTGCRAPCVRDAYTVDYRRDAPAHTGSNRTGVYLFYADTRVRTTEEYLLFDFGAIVTAVGGSLGLFLGFSCWQTVLLAAGWVEGLVAARRGDGQNRSC